jgi:hypothetical protein
MRVAPMREVDEEALDGGLGLEVEVVLDVEDGARDGGVVPSLQQVADRRGDGHQHRATHGA